METGEPMQIQLLEGGAALDRISDPDFRQQWKELHAACPWATALQTLAFADIWYDVYAPAFEPLLALSETEAGRLTGLFALAVNRATKALVTVGAHQAEYQVWLTDAAHGEAFIEAVLGSLASRFPGGHLNLRWLPAGAPVAWLEPGRPWSGRTRFEAFPRPLMTVGPGSTVEAGLRKKNNKHRLNRLNDLGPVSLDVLRSRAEIEPIFDQLVSFCNFRNGARYECLPFQDDPFKREFYLRLVDAPEITHASVLRAGNHILAANIGGRERSSVQLGLITQSPFVSKYSPGVLLFLLLGRELGQAGYQDLDLTPSDDLRYKDRFADHFDTVYTLTVFFREQEALRFDRKRRTIARVKAGLARIGLTPDGIRQVLGRLNRRVRGTLPTTMLFQALRGVLRRVWSSTRLNVYRLSARGAALVEGSDRFNRDCVDDLLRYEPHKPEDRTRFEFLRDAFNRLEDGGHVFTLQRGGQLVHHAWVSPITGPVTTNLGSPYEVPPGSVLLWDEHSHRSVANDDLFRSSVRTRVQEAASMVGEEGGIFIHLPARDHAACESMDRLGFQHHGSLTRRLRFGLRRWTWQLD